MIKKINDILRYKKVLFLSVIIVVEIILVVLFTILIITTNIEFFNYIVESLRNFIILTSVLTALTIPFVMKDIEENKREVELRDRIETAINELKNYFEIIISSKFAGLPKKNLYFSPQFQFFKSIARKEPEFLKKIGIDISLFTSSSKSGTQFEGATLIILNIYRLRGGFQPTLTFISTNNEFSEIPDSYEILLKKIIENVEKNFSIKLDKNLCFLSNNLKSSYIEVTKH
ncbi:hypothetical protein LCGC14_0945810 [marine sediment metagenome]|uniref:Uncharacterized protein n=1 Tax=marine sediment metagenome TaxID=412755 RepID=A0A0F9RQ47_9ZZZZ